MPSAADDCSSLLITSFKHTLLSSHLELPLDQQEVGRLQVTVHNALLMNTRNSLQQTTNGQCDTQTLQPSLVAAW